MEVEGPEDFHKKMEKRLKEDAVDRSTHHPDKPGAGAKKRAHLPSKEKAEAVMKEFHNGTLRSGSGEHVTDINQAKAIAASVAKGD